jgi:hypothetical protein
VRCPFEVIKQTPPGGYELEQTSTGGMIFPESFQMIRQLINSTGQQRDLNVCTASVPFVQPKRTQINVVTGCHISKEV